MNRTRITVLLTGLVMLILGALAGSALLLWTREPSYGPVCLGLIVTGCEGAAASAPTRAGSSPLAFLALLVIGAWGTTWIANRTQPAGEQDDAPETNEEEEEVGR